MATMKQAADFGHKVMRAVFTLTGKIPGPV